MRDDIFKDQQAMLDVLTSCGVKLPEQINRSNINVRCPFCDDKKKHLYVSLDTSMYYCHKCSAKGNLLSFYAQVHNISNAEAYKILAGRDNVDHDQSSPKRKIETKIAKTANLAPAAQRHAVYCVLLKNLELEQQHRQGLLNRGLNDQLIARFGFKSMPVNRSAEIAKLIIDKGLSLEGVPGFYKDKSGVWRLRSTDTVNGKTLHPGMTGYLIPVCDSKGRIQGFQIRRDQGADPKYIWMSTADYESGCAAKSWCHYIGAPLSTGFVKEVVLTEGALKADIIHAYCGKSVLAVMGVNATGELTAALARMQKSGVRCVSMAFDMDLYSNPNVMRAFRKVHKTLEDMHFRIRIIEWSKEYKGLDDYFLATLGPR